jgi:hypothetical protein
MKKTVCSSNLSLRFYKEDGWTRECLEKYLIRGEISDTEITHGDDPEFAYYILKTNSKLDMKRLYEEQVGRVDRAFDDYPTMTDLQFMESKNW